MCGEASHWPTLPANLAIPGLPDQPRYSDSGQLGTIAEVKIENRYLPTPPTYIGT